eukprot:g3936.t1
MMSSMSEMPAEDKEALLRARRELYIGGAEGLAAGSLLAIASYSGLRAAQSRNLVKLNFQLLPKHATAFVLVSAAVGMIVGSTVRGKNASYQLSGVFSRGAKPVLTPYQRAQRMDGDGREISDADLGYDSRAASLHDYGLGVQAKHRVVRRNRYGDAIQ